MEISLLKYTNFISKFQERVLMIKHDEFKYKQNIDTEEFDRVIHNEFIEFINYKKDDDQLVVITSEKSLFISHNKEISNGAITLYIFRSYFNFMKFSYLMNLIHYKFQNEEKYRFNTKEYVVNLKQYVKNEIFIEVITNISNKKEELGFIIEILHTKLKNFTQYLQTHSKSDIYQIHEIIKTIEDDFNQQCVNIYKEKMNDLDNYNNGSSISDQQVTFDLDNKINTIDNVQEVYLNLCRIYTEIQRSLVERKVFSLAKVNGIKLVCNNDIIEKHIKHIIRDSENRNIINLNIQKMSKLNSELKVVEEKLIVENKNEKESLKIFLSNRSLQIFFCFKCGNLLKRTKRCKSNCLIDLTCQDVSYFECLNCTTNFCTGCIIEIKSGKCAKGHLVFKYEGHFNKYCRICHGGIFVEGYSCNLCDISVCCSCYDTYGIFCPPKCSHCKYELQWRRSLYSQCNKCTLYSDCNWKCFFCDVMYCNKCIPPLHSYCGQLHKLETFILSKFQGGTYLSRMYVDHTSRLKFFLNNPLGKMMVNCSKCDLILPSEFKCCRRCNYSICNNCNIII